MIEQNRRAIYLVGMMGSGKSTIGQRLAEVLKLPYIDLDTEIIQTELKSIQDLFESKGETYFREVEAKTLRSTKVTDVIISTGGGTPLYHDSMQYMLDHGEVIWIKCSLKTILKRITKDKDRPLGIGITYSKLSNMYKHRKLIYQKATIKVWNKGSVGSVVDRILNKLN